MVFPSGYVFKVYSRINIVQDSDSVAIGRISINLLYTIAMELEQFFCFDFFFFRTCSRGFNASGYHGLVLCHKIPDYNLFLMRSCWDKSIYKFHNGTIVLVKFTFM